MDFAGQQSQRWLPLRSQKPLQLDHAQLRRLRDRAEPILPPPPALTSVESALPMASADQGRRMKLGTLSLAIVVGAITPRSWTSFPHAITLAAMPTC